MNSQKAQTVSATLKLFAALIQRGCPDTARGEVLTRTGGEEKVEEKHTSRNSDA